MWDYCEICKIHQFDNFVDFIEKNSWVLFILSLLFLLVINILVKNLVMKIYIKSQNESTADLNCEMLKVRLLQRNVSIKSSPGNCFDRLIDLFFIRWHFFNNINNHNSKNTIKTIMIVLNLFSLLWVVSYCFGAGLGKNFTEFFAAALASFVATFWHLDNVFQKKWKHCADVSYRYLELDLSDPLTARGIEHFEEDPKQEKFNEICYHYEHAFVIDLLHLDLWAHKSFYRHFNNILYYRIMSKYRSNEAIEKLNKLYNGQLFVTDIEDILRS